MAFRSTARLKDKLTFLAQHPTWNLAPLILMILGGSIWIMRQFHYLQTPPAPLVPTQTTVPPGSKSPEPPKKPHHIPVPNSQSVGMETVRDAKDCPPGYTVLDSNTFSDNGVGVSAPANAKICTVNNKFDRNGKAYELKGKP